MLEGNDSNRCGIILHLVIIMNEKKEQSGKLGAIKYDAHHSSNGPISQLY